MPYFHYKAIDPAGEETSGTLEAADVVQAATQLAEQGMTVQGLQQMEEPGSESETEPVVESSTSRDTTPGAKPSLVSFASSGEEGPTPLATLTRLWSEAVANRQQLLPALKAYAADAGDRKAANALNRLIELLEKAPDEASGKINGTMSSQQLIENYQRDAKYHCALFAANEGAPSSSLFLQRFSKRLTPAEVMPQRLTRALIYPISVLLLTVIVLAGIASMVVPTFESIFNDFGLELPAATRLLIKISHWFQLSFLVNTFLWLVTLCLLYSFVRWLTQGVLLSRFLGRFSWRLDWVAVRASFTSRVANLLEAGLTRSQSLELAGFGAQRPLLQEGALRLAARMPDHLEPSKTHQDEVLQKIKRHGIVSWRLARQMGHTLTHALQADVSSEARIELLRELAEVDADRTRRSLSLTYGAVGMVAILITAVAVGFATLALFAPLIKLIEGLT